MSLILALESNFLGPGGPPAGFMVLFVLVLVAGVASTIWKV